MIHHADPPVHPIHLPSRGSTTTLALERPPVYPSLHSISFFHSTVPSVCIPPFRPVPSHGDLLLCLPLLAYQAKSVCLFGSITDSIFAYPVISTFFHSSASGGVSTFNLTSELLISHEPSSSLVIF